MRHPALWHSPQARDAASPDSPSAMARRPLPVGRRHARGEIARVDYDVRERTEYIGSPAKELIGGATEVRENLDRGGAQEQAGL